MFNQIYDGFGKTLHIAVLHKYSVFMVAYYISRAVRTVEADARRAARHSLNQHKPEALTARRQNKDIASGKLFDNTFCRPFDRDAATQCQSVNQSFQLCLLLSGTENIKGPVRMALCNSSPCFYQHVEPFLIDQPAGGYDPLKSTTSRHCTLIIIYVRNDTHTASLAPFACVTIRQSHHNISPLFNPADIPVEKKIMKPPYYPTSRHSVPTARKRAGTVTLHYFSCPAPQ